MRKPPVLCYITDRKAFAGSESAQREALLCKIAEAAQAGVDFVQLREKDLSGRDLERLALAAVGAPRRHSPSSTGSPTKLLINSRVDVALAAAADGVHLPAHDLSPAEALSVWRRAQRSAPPIVSFSCHTLEDVRTAARDRVDFVLFAPVFGKKGLPSVASSGLPALREACLVPIPVLALGGVTLANARTCLEAGAAGIAAIRLFQENDVAGIVRQLRS